MLPIIYDYCVRSAEFANDLFLKIIPHTSFGNYGDNLHLYPLGEVINCYDKKFLLTYRDGKGPRMSIPHTIKGHKLPMGY